MGEGAYDVDGREAGCGEVVQEVAGGEVRGYGEFLWRQVAGRLEPVVCVFWCWEGGGETPFGWDSCVNLFAFGGGFLFPGREVCGRRCG